MRPVNGSSARQRLIEALALIIALALVARVVSQILAPLLPGLVGLIVVGCLLVMLFRRR